MRLCRQGSCDGPSAVWYPFLFLITNPERSYPNFWSGYFNMICCVYCSLSRGFEMHTLWMVIRCQGRHDIDSVLEVLSEPKKQPWPDLKLYPWGSCYRSWTRFLGLANFVTSNLYWLVLLDLHFPTCIPLIYFSNRPLKYLSLFLARNCIIPAPFMYLFSWVFCAPMPQQGSIIPKQNYMVTKDPAA